MIGFESFSRNLVLYVVLLGAVTYWYFRRSFAYWNNKNVKTLPTVPLFGSYWESLLMQKNIAINLKEVYFKFINERYVGGFKGSVPELVLIDPEIIPHVLIKDFNVFQDRDNNSMNSIEILEQNLLSFKGEKWRNLRQKLTPLFTSSKQKKMFPLIAECGKGLQTYISQLLEQSNELEVKELMAKYTTDTIGSCAFGLKMDSMTDENAPLRKISRKMGTFTRRLAIVKFLYGEIPGLSRILRVKTRSTVDELEIFFLGLVKELTTNRSADPTRNNFIDMLIELRTKGYSGGDKSDKIDNPLCGDIQVTDEFMAAQAYIFFLGGFETSSSALSFALRELALNPEVQKKLQDEIDSVLVKYDGEVTYDALSEMIYLDMVINETLRKYPPLPKIIRACNSKYKFPDSDLIIDKGVSVIIPLLGFHYDPKYFPEPEKFIPERFSSGIEKTFHPFSYLPFSDGPRNCIGLRFGRFQVATGLISVLSKYSLETCSRTIANLEFDAYSPFLQPVGGVWLKVTRRHVLWPCVSPSVAKSFCV